MSTQPEPKRLLSTNTEQRNIVRESLSKIKSGVNDIVYIMTPAQRLMVSEEISAILDGLTTIESVYE